MPEAAHATEAVDLLVLELGGVRYGLDLSAIREVVRAVLITPLPDAPPVVEGVIDVRGAVVPVYDLRARFGLPPRPLHPDEQMVIAWTGDRLVAVRCDHVPDVESVTPDRLDSAVALPGGDRHIAGVARLPGGLVLIHDLATFLEEAEELSLDEALVRRGRSG
jgi:purine-binding chemotaxis protein CheW